MATPDATSSTYGSPPAFVGRRMRMRWWLLIAGIVAAVQIWSLWRGTMNVRVVVYNQGPAALEEAVFTCAGETVEIGALEVEQSRYGWFHPAERTAVIGLSWRAGETPLESAWAVERGERLTVRLRSDGEMTASREASLGKKLFDALAGD